MTFEHRYSDLSDEYLSMIPVRIDTCSHQPFCSFILLQHAHALELLKDHLKEGNKALDVGSGSGYLTACMALMVGPRGKAVRMFLISCVRFWIYFSYFKHSKSLASILYNSFNFDGLPLRS